VQGGVGDEPGKPAHRSGAWLLLHRHHAAALDRVDRDLDASRAGRAEADLQDDAARRGVLEDLRGVVQLGAGQPDRVVEFAALVRPVGIDATKPPGPDDPARIGVGVVEHCEHGRWRSGDIDAVL